MTRALAGGEIDVAIGLTEGWVTALATPSTRSPFKLVGSYVDTPLCWGVSTGSQREEIKTLSDLKGGKVGVSRVGSGSYVMSFVLADDQGWLRETRNAPFEVVELQNFERLRDGVSRGAADFFMWEHFTTKKFWDSGEIKRVGEIYTPWPSWMIVARDEYLSDFELGTQLNEFLTRLELGVEHFNANKDEAVELIADEIGDYSEEDAREWMKTVTFSKDMKGVKVKVIEDVVEVLKKAGVVGETNAENMIGITRASK